MSLRFRVLMFACGLAVSMGILFAGSPARAATYYWTTSTGTGGNGTWDGSTNNWASPNTNSPLTFWSGSSGDTAEFYAGSGAVAISGAQTVGNINFDATAGVYTLSGGTLNLSGNITANQNAEIDSAISGGNLNTYGTATLTFGGANTYTGGATVNAGAINVAAGGSITAAAGQFVVSNGGGNAVLALNGGTVSANYGGSPSLLVGNASAGAVVVNSGLLTTAQALYLGYNNDNSFGADHRRRLRLRGQFPWDRPREQHERKRRAGRIHHDRRHAVRNAQRIRPRRVWLEIRSWGRAEPGLNFRRRNQRQREHPRRRGRQRRPRYVRRR